MRLIDTHCHIDLYPNYTDVIKATEDAQIYTIAVTNTPSVFQHCEALLRGRRFLKPALGLHPELVIQRHREMALFSELLHHTRYVGEVGLDFVTSDSEMRSLQRWVFGTVLDQCAQQGSKILTIHSRRAAAEVVEMIGDNYSNTCILHWFAGSAKVFQRAVRQGFYFSINSSMLKSLKGRALINVIPRDLVLTETDGPFVRVQGRAAQPKDVQNTIVQLSSIWNTTVEEAQSCVYNNFRRILEANM